MPYRHLQLPGSLPFRTAPPRTAILALTTLSWWKFAQTFMERVIQGSLRCPPIVKFPTWLSDTSHASRNLWQRQRPGRATIFLFFIDTLTRIIACNISSHYLYALMTSTVIADTARSVG